MLCDMLLSQLQARVTWFECQSLHADRQESDVLSERCPICTYNLSTVASAISNLTVQENMLQVYKH
jgi:hypothetical protein